MSERHSTPAVCYLAAGFGAFCLGFGDLINNGNSATVLKISEIIRQYLYPALSYGGLISLLFLAVLGAGMCWIFQPQTRADAFGRGFSVFAILAVVTPFDEPPGGLNSPTPELTTEAISFSFFPKAWAQVPQPPNTAARVSPRGKALITLRPKKTKDRIRYATVTVRDPKTARIVAVERIKGDRFTLKKPIGTYWLEIESPGFERTRTTIKISHQSANYSLPIRSAKLPLSIQRLFAARKVTAQRGRPPSG